MYSTYVISFYSFALSVTAGMQLVIGWECNNVIVSNNAIILIDQLDLSYTKCSTRSCTLNIVIAKDYTF